MGALVALREKETKPEGSTSNGDPASSADMAKGKKKENAACKHIDQLLWKAEVDLENVEDMYLRHIDNSKDTVTPFSVSMADLNSTISRAMSEMEDTFSRKISELTSWGSR